MTALPPVVVSELGASAGRGRRSRARPRPAQRKPGMTVVRGRVITPYADLPDAVVEIDGDRIARCGKRPRDDSLPPSDVLIIPGLVDLHCHGGGGASFTSGDRAAGRDGRHPPPAQRHHQRRRQRRHRRPRPDAGGDGHPRRRGGRGVAGRRSTSRGRSWRPPAAARRTRAWLTAPDLGLARALLEAGRGHVRMMTLAPELPGADELAEVVRDHGAPGRGRSHRCSGRRGRRVPAPARPERRHAPLQRHGAASPPLTRAGPRVPAPPRWPAPRWSSWSPTACTSTTQTVAGVMALVGADRVVLVTDAMAAAGHGRRRATSSGRSRSRVVDGVARLADGDSIAGGTARLLDVVRRQVTAGLVAG